MSEVTRILSAIEQGAPEAAGRLLPLVYDELRRLAACKLAQEKPGHTLQPTALVHEAYVRLVDADEARHWDSRRHFFAAAAEAMRRILIESARHKKRQRHGGGHARVGLDEAPDVSEPRGEDVLAVNEALEQLGGADPQAAELVKLRFFAGLSIEEAAAGLGISERTAYRTWSFAKAWLFRRLHPDEVIGEPVSGP
jgi:RNA polymerase sigma factor (TIGR02999 family)